MKGRMEFYMMEHDKLIKKLETEYQEYVCQIKQEKPEEIIKNAYELVIKEDIVESLKYKNLDANKINALLNRSNVLDDLYNDWKNADVTPVMDHIYDVVKERIEDITEEYVKNKKDKGRER